LDGSLQTRNASDRRLELENPVDKIRLQYPGREPSDREVLQVTDIAAISSLEHRSLCDTCTSSLPADSNISGLAPPEGVSSPREECNHIIMETVVTSDLADELEAREVESSHVPDTNDTKD
jgi:hypothetical protein